MRISLRVARQVLDCKEVRVRFAPSPTGHLHIGGLRTAFFNYLFAKKHGGTFVLRIEDTDRTRLVLGAQEKIYDTLKMYSLDPDEGPVEGGSYGPYEQSKRLENYKEATHQLMESGHAYRCFCTEERLELLRKDASRRGEIPKYDRKCMHLSSEESSIMERNGEKYVVRLRLDRQNVTFQDEVYGEITQKVDESDAVLLKSDGFPTYHLANVVDDRKMQISHVIRGMEWLSSTGKHRILYNAFNWKPPKFVHLPLIMRSATKKLSKRDADAYVAYYNDTIGVLPGAVLNLLIRNGDGIRDFETNRLYEIEEIIERFDLGLVGRRNLLLDSDVLDKYSRLAFQNADFETVLYPKIIKIIGNHDEIKNNIPGKDYIRKIVDFLRSKEENFGKLSSLTSGEFSWFFTRPKSSELLFKTFPNEDIRGILEELKTLDSWNNKTFSDISLRRNMKNSHLMGIIRISLIGNKKGPPISELVEFLGIDECRNRMEIMKKLL